MRANEFIGPSEGATRVVHVTTVHKPTDNRIVRKECTSLIRAGFDVRLIAKAPVQTRQSGEVPVLPIPPRSNRLSRVVLGSLDVWRKLRVIKPDVVHVHDPELIPLAVLWKWTSGCAAVFDSHEDFPKQVKGKHYINRHLKTPATVLAIVLQSVADRLLSGVVVATPSIAQNFTNKTVALVQNFPWRDVYCNAYSGEMPEHFTLGYVGGITRVRGIREMVAASQSTDPPTKLLLAGPITDGSAPDLEAADKAGNLDYRGVLDPDEIPHVLREVSVGLVLLYPVPNHLESQPTKIYEYMAAGRPFIASDFPAWVEKFGSFDCGLFVDPADAQAVSRAVQTLIDEPEATVEMGKRGRRAVLDNFVFETQVETLVRFTRDVALNSRASRRRRAVVR